MTDVRGASRPGGPRTLDHYELHAGDRVRFRRSDGGRWSEAVVEGVARDGSVALRDDKGASRAITADRLEVRVRTTRGAFAWEPVLDRAARTPQRRLFEP